MIWIPSKAFGRDKLTYTTYATLGGGIVPLEAVCDELARHPIDRVLGMLSRFSAVCLTDPRFNDPRSRHGELLARAIVDDFPTTLRNASKMYSPGRVPVTGERHTFIHEHNLCALAKLAIERAQLGQVTAQLTQADECRISRLLLIVNDHLALELSGVGPFTLKTRRALAQETLYLGQFNHYDGDPREPLLGIGRLRKVMNLLPHRAAHDRAFHDRCGYGFDAYFDCAIVLLDFAYRVMQATGPEHSPWLLAKSFANAPVHYPEALAALVQELSQQPVEARRAAQPQLRDVFSFELLQERPLVEARPGELIAPVFSLLLRRLLAYPITTLEGVSSFRQDLGDAYEQYAHGLVARLACSDRRRFKVREGEAMSGSEIDSLLLTDDIAIIWEHKAKNLVPHVGSLKTARNALGPPDEKLSRVATLNKKEDTAAVTQPIWQMRDIAKTFDEHAQRSWGCRPMHVFPLVTLMESYKVEEWVRRGYLEPLMQEADIRWPQTWHPIQWMHIADLEGLVALAARGTLDLVGLLMLKGSTDQYRWMRFDQFLAFRDNGVPIDPELWKETSTFVESVAGIAPT